MRTVVRITRSESITAGSFHYLNVMDVDSIGIAYSQSMYMISAEQYALLRGGKDEMFENGVYYVNVC